MRLLVLTLALLTPALPAASQQPATGIAGSVTDQAGLPLEGAMVSLHGDAGAWTALTDRDGRFRIDGIPPGSYQLSGKDERHRESAQTVVLTTGILEVNFELQTIPVFTLIATASRTGEQSLISAPASVSVVGSEQIEASAAENVPDLLRAVPGVNFTQFNARDLDINARSSTGVLSNSMLVMVDGRSFFQPLYGATYWDLMTMPKNEISQIEVMRSPASATWGANALNGVVNIRTKAPRQMTGLQGDLAFGERGTRSAGVTWAEALNTLSYKLSASYYEQDPWDRDNRLPDGSPMPSAVIYENRGTKQPKFDARVDLDGDRSRVWSLRGGMAGAYGQTQSALGPGEFGSGSYYSYAEVERTSNNFDFKMYWNRLESPFKIVLYDLAEHATNDTYAFDINRTLKAGDRHNLTFGGSLRLDRFNVTIAPDQTHRMDGAAFVEDQVSVNRKTTVVVGGRLDKFNTTDVVFAPRLSLVVTPKPAHSFRVAYNRAYRAPSLLENFLNVTLPAVVPIDPPFYYSQLTLGAPDLKMEKQDAVEVGYTGVIRSHATVSATVYDQRISNNVWFLPVSFYGPGAPPPGWPGDPSSVPVLPKEFTFLNLGQVRDRGLELGGRVEWASVSIQGNYTFQQDPRLDTGTDLPLQINLPPRHQGGVGLTYRINQWTAAADVHYTDRAFWADVLTQPFWGYTNAYTGVNARVSYRLPNRRWELWLSATDLLDEQIKSHVYGDTIRRKVSTGVHWQWGP
jgi:iron complex outermembrane receptor protein